MTQPIRTSLCLLLLSSLALSACKPKEKPAEVVAPASIPAAPVASAVSTAVSVPAQPFDVTTVPLSTAVLPPFPFVALPKEAADEHGEDEKDFERIYVLAGEELRPVEGHFSNRRFQTRLTKMSGLGMFRNYDQVIKSLGAVAVNKVLPGSKSFVAQNGGDEYAILKKLKVINTTDSLPNEVPPFTQYLLRTATGNIWIALSFYDGESGVSLVVLEEKPLQQIVGVTTAAAKPAQ